MGKTASRSFLVQGDAGSQQSPGLQLLRVPLKDQPSPFHQSTRALEGTGEAPHSLPTLSQAEPAMGLLGQALSLGLGHGHPGCQGPCGTGCFLGFLPVGRLGEGLLFDDDREA